MAGHHSEWQNETVIKAFLRDIRGAIPGAELQLEVLGTIVGAWCPHPRCLVDLGCGDGLLGRTLLTRCPEARALFVDFSDPMLAEAKERLQGDGRARIIKADMSGPGWLEALGQPGDVDVVVSGFAIHHQPDERKRALYAEIFSLLAPGGLFLNLEQVAMATPRLQDLAEDHFVESIYQYHKRQGGPLLREDIVDAFSRRPTRDENILAPVPAQCDWLRAIGFTDVDCFFRLFAMAIFGGVKPTTSR